MIYARLHFLWPVRIRVVAKLGPLKTGLEVCHRADVDKNSIKYSKKDVDKSLDMYFARPKK
jgi:hypothetical protein